MTRVRLLGMSGLLCGLAVTFVGISACSDGEIVKEPTSDKNFDDPDEPATPGPVGATDASTADVVVACSSDIECPPRAARCMFPATQGCTAQGSCVSFVPLNDCVKKRFCGCSGGGVTACAPDGLSPIPVAPGVSCGELDAGDDTPEAGADAALADAPSDG